MSLTPDPAPAEPDAARHGATNPGHTKLAGLARETLGVLALRIGGLALQVGLFAVLARLLSLADMGLLALALVVPVIARNAGSFGYEYVVMRHVPAALDAGDSRGARRIEQQAAGRVLAWSLLAVGLLALTAGLLSRAGAIPWTIKALAIGCVPVATGVGLIAVMIRARGSIVGSQVPEAIVLNLLWGAFLGPMWLAGRIDAAGALAAYVAANALTLALQMALLARQRAARGLTGPGSGLPPGTAWSAARLMGFHLLVTLANRQPVIMAGALLPLAQVALVEAALRLASPTQFLNWAVATSLLPRYARALARKDQAEVQTLWHVQCWVSLLPALIACAAVGAAGGWILAVVAGDPYRAAQPLLLAMMLAFTVQCAVESTRLLNVAGRETITLAVVGVRVVLLGGLSLAASRLCGAAGIGIAMAITTLITESLQLLAVRHTLRLEGPFWSRAGWRTGLGLSRAIPRWRRT